MEAFKRNTTINVLCGLIILILAASVCLPVYRFSVAFGYGLSAGFEEDGTGMKRKYPYLSMSFSNRRLRAMPLLPTQ